MSDLEDNSFQPRQSTRGGAKAKGPRGGGGGGSGGGRGRGGRGKGGDRRSQDPEVVLSKSLSYILRHGAQREGLSLRSDGYVKLDDLLARPKLRGVTFDDVKNVVETNSKQRFTMLFEPAEDEKGNKGVPVEFPPRENVDEHARQIPAPVEGSSASGASTSAASTSAAPNATVSLDDLLNRPGAWWIRANQGHSLKVEALELTPITDAAEVPVAIHGTNLGAWNKISKKGLSIMGRNHIHIAAGLPGASGVISGMRTSSDILIHIDIARALSAGIKFYRSANNVLLTAGNEEGFIPKEFFSKVERRNGTEVDNAWKTTV